MIDRYAALVLLGIAFVFGFTATKGLRDGFTRIPIAFFEFEEFDRIENPANFWGVTVLNSGIAIIMVSTISYWIMNGMIE